MTYSIKISVFYPLVATTDGAITTTHKTVTPTASHTLTRSDKYLPEIRPSRVFPGLCLESTSTEPGATWPTATLCVSCARRSISRVQSRSLGSKVQSRSLTSNVHSRLGCIGRVETSLYVSPLVGEAIVWFSPRCSWCIVDTLLSL